MTPDRLATVRIVAGPVLRRLLSRATVDTTPLRASRDYRLLLGGELITGLGTQAALVALPYQLYVETRSAFLTGLLGAVELIPLMAMALLGGALADRHDRRKLLLLDQIGLVLGASALAALAYAGSPPIGVVVRLGRVDGGLHRDPERDRGVDHPQPGRAGAAAPARWR